MNNDRSLTQELQAFFQGDQTGAEALLREILPKLHEIAVRELHREQHGAPISATELIHEIWLRNISKSAWKIRDRGHFYAIASLAMRRVLVDLARSRLAKRRDSNGFGSSSDSRISDRRLSDSRQIVEIGILMERLETHDPDAARILDMHYFAGFTLNEIAESTKLTLRQVRSRWERAQKWLQGNLKSARAHA